MIWPDQRASRAGRRSQRLFDGARARMLPLITLVRSRRQSRGNLQATHVCRRHFFDRSGQASSHEKAIAPSGCVWLRSPSAQGSGNVGASRHRPFRRWPANQLMARRVSSWLGTLARRRTLFCSFSRARISNCRTRSFEMPNSRPISSSDVASSARRRAMMIF